MITKEALDGLEELVSLMTPGPYTWVRSAEGVSPRDFIDSITNKTDAHPEKSIDGRVHSVEAKSPEGEDLTVALTGFGPKGHANARGLMAVLTAFPELLRLARLGAAVEAMPKDSELGHRSTGAHHQGEYWEYLEFCEYTGEQKVSQQGSTPAEALQEAAQAKEEPCQTD